MDMELGGKGGATRGFSLTQRTTPLLVTKGDS